MKSKPHVVTPKIIVLASGKGGVGKSTLARSLAAHWLTVGQYPALIDADPQASILSLHDPDGPMANVSVLASPEAETITHTIQDAARSHGVVIIDTAGFRNQTTIMACVAADLVLIPLKPAAEDIREAVAMLNLITELNATPERVGRPIKAKMVLTMVSPGTLIARQVRKELEKAGYPLLDAEIIQRVAYPEFSMRGLAPSIVDPEGAAARDIAELISEISKEGGSAYVEAA